MRISAYLYSAPPQRIVGGEKMTLTLLEHASKNGFDVTLVVKEFKQEAEYAGMRIVPAADTHTSRSVFKNSRFIITHPEIAKAVAPYNRTIGIIHNLGSGTIDGCKQDFVHLIANSQSTFEGGRKLGLRPDSIIRPPLKKPTIFKHNPHMVFSSNLSVAKGSNIFYATARELPHIPFLGVPGGYDQQEIVTFPNVMYMGHGPLDLAFANTKVFLTASQSETYGMTLGEATLCGIPSVASDIEAHNEVLGDSGIKVPLGSNYKTWVQAISDLYSDEVFYKEMEMAAQARGEELEQQSKDSLDQWLNLLTML